MKINLMKIKRYFSSALAVRKVILYEKKIEVDLSSGCRKKPEDVIFRFYPQAGK